MSNRRGPSPALWIAAIVGMAAIGWFLPHRASRIAPGAAVPASRHANTPALAKAAASYDRACEGGNAQACTNLGVMYDNGRGVGHDEARAAALYQRGCDHGDAAGCTHLGRLYEGRPGDLPKGADRAGCANVSRDERVAVIAA